MTEKEWLRCTDLKRMLTFAQGKLSDRRLRLFACACCRRTWKSLTLKPVRSAVGAAERYAEGSATERELDDAHRAGIAAYTRMLHRTVKKMRDPEYALKMYRLARAVNTAHTGLFQVKMIEGFGDDEALKAVGPALLRCVGGNPFRPVTADPTWLSSDVVALARGISEGGAFDRLPVLADALLDAGCDDPDVLGHCRSAGPHDRHCWVIDSVLGKE
jgi:hypothetical protein